MKATPPPYLYPAGTKVDGLAFIGLSLSRNHNELLESNSKSMTRQQSFNFNEIQDREYKFIKSTNDDGWLVGGGENETSSWKLPAPDSAHTEIMRIGSFDPSLGGLQISAIQEAIADGTILIPVIKVSPTSIVLNSDFPPEVEVRFDMEPDAAKPCIEWLNWQLMFVHNQLFSRFNYPARFCPGAFHMTFTRKATFENEGTKQKYLSQVWLESLLSLA